MAGNFPEVWLNRVITNLTTADAAPWLAGISELDVPVTELGEGSDGESNIIQVPTSTFEPDVLLNNNVYPLLSQPYTDSTLPIQLDKYQTKATSVTDDQAIGAAYNKIDAVTRSHTTAILKKKYQRAAWNLAPATNGANTPVVVTTGTASSGQRKPMTYNDIVMLKSKFDAMDCPVEGRRLILCSDHLNDLLLDRQNFGNLLVNYNEGKPLGKVAGFEMYEYINNPVYDKGTGARLAWGAAQGTNYQGSVAFLETNVGLRTGMTKQYFSPAKADPLNQQNLLNYRHYHIALPLRSKYMGAIYSANA